MNHEMPNGHMETARASGPRKEKNEHYKPFKVLIYSFAFIAFFLSIELVLVRRKIYQYDKPRFDCIAPAGSSVQ